MFLWCGIHIVPRRRAWPVSFSSLQSPHHLSSLNSSHRQSPQQKVEMHAGSPGVIRIQVRTTYFRDSLFKRSFVRMEYIIIRPPSYSIQARVIGTSSHLKDSYRGVCDLCSALYLIMV